MVRGVGAMPGVLWSEALRERRVGSACKAAGSSRSGSRRLVRRTARWASRRGQHGDAWRRQG